MKSSLKRCRAHLFVAIVVLAATQHAQAAAPCEDAFQELKAPDGATFNTTTIAYSETDARDVLDGFKAAATGMGYVVVSPPSYSGPTPTLGVGHPSSAHPVAITVNPRASTVSLTTIVAPGLKADAVAERARLCDLAAEFNARRTGGSRLTAEQQQLRARTSMPRPVESVRLLSPTTAFDPVAAKAALQPGRSVIRGQACGHWNGAMALASGSTVLLYPATPHLEQVLKLEKRARAGKERVVPNPALFEVRMEAVANERGEFQFSQMRPGRYYVVTTLGATFTGTRDVYAGRVENGFGSANVYRSEGYTFTDEDQLGKFVEIGRDGEVVKVTLQPPVSANPFRRGMGGSILGCRQI
ncbi:MAG: hypothetical protein ACOY37_04895 [Pseudomonadota bacterium]